MNAIQKKEIVKNAIIEYLERILFYSYLSRDEIDGMAEYIVKRLYDGLEDKIEDPVETYFGYIENPLTRLMAVSMAKDELAVYEGTPSYKTNLIRVCAKVSNIFGKI